MSLQLFYVNKYIETEKIITVYIHYYLFIRFNLRRKENEKIEVKVTTFVDTE